jgi:hypothetical protein
MVIDIPLASSLIARSLSGGYGGIMARVSLTQPYNRTVHDETTVRGAGTAGPRDTSGKSLSAPYQKV